MSRIVQEKQEILEPYEDNDDAHGGWVSDASARRGKDRISSTTLLNSMPPGSNIANQERRTIRPMGTNLAGRRGRDRLAQGDRTQDINRRSLLDGFDRKPMAPTDGTTEHGDMFYGEAEVDGDVGFAERNNTLDRL
jgi:hypothetical protein